ncbi:MAG: glucose 1-dehydrogenase [Candidatus Dadabacteria bacterium]|nr:MAG: glucose 1-dehydrogenase [Candidatus Dadabacteria bacterium]
MAGKLEGKVAVITGGGSGIGRGTVLRFLREGAKVVVADLNERTGRETLDLAAKEGLGDRARFIKTDVSKEADVEAMIDLAMNEFGRLDCVYNNAGLPGALGALDEISADDWDFTFAVLVRGVFLGIKHAARVLKQQNQGGVILNTGSTAGLSGGCGPHAYSAAKAAVINLTRSASVELAQHNIRVNVICPGGILTPLVHRGSEEAMEEGMRNSQPLKIVGRAEDVAALACFLASDEARFVTGGVYVIDGGLTAAGPHVYRGQWEAVMGAGLDRGTVDF